MGRPKPLLRLEGRTLAERAVDAARGAELRPLVVLGAHADRIRSAIRDIPAVFNGSWRDGMASSIVCGVNALPDDTELAVVMNVDQPDVDAAFLRALVDACNDDFEASASRYPGGELGAPACFRSDCFETLADLDGDCGARELIRSDRWRIAAVDAEHRALDVDTPEQWRDYVDALADGGSR